MPWRSAIAERRLVCPSCGWDASDLGRRGHRFLYLEEVTNQRPVYGIHEAGMLQIEAFNQIGIDDGGWNQRLLCGNCLTEFPLPERFEIDLAS